MFVFYFVQDDELVQHERKVLSLIDIIAAIGGFSQALLGFITFAIAGYL